MFSGVDDDQMKEYERMRPHVLIGTPKRILELLETNLHDFTSLRRLVLDEVDKILLPLSKRASAKEKAVREIHPRPGSLIVKKLVGLSKRWNMQLICASATVNPALKEELEELGWEPETDLISTTSSGLASPSSIEHQYVQCSSQEGMNKVEVLIEHFYNSREKSALVFIHRGSSVTKFVEELNAKGMKAVALHMKTLSPLEYKEFLSDFKSGGAQLVIGTEETVRGLDFTWLNMVYLMEVPRNVSEYLPLCGRVGRLGRPGRTVVFVNGDQELKRLLLHYSRLKVKGSQIELS